MVISVSGVWRVTCAYGWSTSFSNKCRVCALQRRSGSCKPCSQEWVTTIAPHISFLLSKYQLGVEGRHWSLSLWSTHHSYTGIFFLSVNLYQSLSFCFLYAKSFVDSLLNLISSSQWDYWGGSVTTPNFPTQTTKTRRADMPWLRSPSQWVAEPGFKSSLSAPVALACIPYPCVSQRRGSNQIREGDKETRSDWGLVSIWPFLSSSRGENSLSISSPCDYWTGWTIFRSVWAISYSAKRPFPFPR